MTALPCGIPMATSNLCTCWLAIWYHFGPLPVNSLILPARLQHVAGHLDHCLCLESANPRVITAHVCTLMWALQLHLCWMRPWLGCLWKGPTEGNAKGCETESPWCQTYVQAAQACGFLSQEGPRGWNPQRRRGRCSRLRAYLNTFSRSPAADLGSAIH